MSNIQLNEDEEIAVTFGFMNKTTWTFDNVDEAVAHYEAQEHAEMYLRTKIVAKGRYGEEEDE